MTELRVFISYRRNDTSGDARSIYQHLSRCFGKDRIFMDVDSIRPGGDFREVLRESLGSTRVLLALIGPKWNENNRLSNPADFVRLEVLGALDAGISVIPLLIDNTTMPLPEELPAALESLAYRQALSIRHQTFSSDVRALEHAIAAELGVTDAPIADQTNTESGLPSTPITEVERYSTILRFSTDPTEEMRFTAAHGENSMFGYLYVRESFRQVGDYVQVGDDLLLIHNSGPRDLPVGNIVAPISGKIERFCWRKDTHTERDKREHEFSRGPTTAQPRFDDNQILLEISSPTKDVSAEAALHDATIHIVTEAKKVKNSAPTALITELLVHVIVGAAISGGLLFLAYSLWNVFSILILAGAGALFYYHVGTMASHNMKVVKWANELQPEKLFKLLD